MLEVLLCEVNKVEESLRSAYRREEVRWRNAGNAAGEVSYMDLEL